MFLSEKFICASEKLCKTGDNVPAPYFRKEFDYNGKANAEITISGLGFYELYINGIKITKGFLSPYISNTNDLIYYDNYNITNYLSEGKNIIGVLLGNGLQNAYGGYVWDFDKADFRSSPKLSMALELDGKVSFEADESFLTFPSPIIEDDLRLGEVYDANKEIENWNLIDFDDCAWKNAIKTNAPKGEKRICNVNPIKIHNTVEPINIWKEDESYIYDFGFNASGIPLLVVNGNKNQKINMIFGERLKDGKFYWENTSFVHDDCIGERKYRQEETYICKGENNETYKPTFTYHGFRYIKVTGITEKQATKSLLTYLVLNTKLDEIGNFKCSDETLNTIQEMTKRATYSNFHHIPTDCPHREKNGWTADAALSCEQTLLNYNPDLNYTEWMRNICKAQNKKGALPGIVPTSGWGFEWGNGPAWDIVVTTIPYYMYRYRGDKEICKISKDAIIKYLNYLDTRKDENGLLAIGLGDWMDPSGDIKAPLILTDSICALEASRQAMVIMNAIDAKKEYEICKTFFDKMKKSIRDNLIDFSTMEFAGNCQTSQAMGIYYDILTPSEKEKALKVLLQIIHKDDDKILTGVLGLNVILHILSEIGENDLAYKMVTRTDAPSYGLWIKDGYTTLGESLLQNNDAASYNHHFMGFISTWFYKDICGINYDITKGENNKLEIKPQFLTNLKSANAYHICPEGKIEVSYTKIANKAELYINIPEKLNGEIIFPIGWTDLCGNKKCKALSGTYILKKVQ